MKTGGLVNWLKFMAGYREQKQSPYLQTHGAFHFLLDYVPNWKYDYKPCGLIQYQSFVPLATAADVLSRLMESTQTRVILP